MIQTERPLSVLTIFPADGEGIAMYPLVERAYWLRQEHIPSRVAVPSSSAWLYREQYPIFSRLSDFFLEFASAEHLCRLAADFAAVMLGCPATVPLLQQILAQNPTLQTTYQIQESDPWPAPRSGRRGLPEVVASLPADALVVSESPWLSRAIARRYGLSVATVRTGIDSDVFYPLTSEAGRSTTRVIVATDVDESLPSVAEVLLAVRTQLGDRVEFEVCGVTVDEWQDATGSPVTCMIHGPVIREQMARVLREGDIYLDLWGPLRSGRHGLEAMACGCAVIVAADSPADDYARDQIDAWVVEADDHDGCCAAVVTLVLDHDRREQLRQGALKRAAEFSCHRAAESDLAVFASVGLGNVWLGSPTIATELKSVILDGIELERAVQAAHRRMDYTEALRLLLPAVATERVRPSAWLWLSRTYLALDDLTAALDALERFAELDPDSPRGVFQRVNILQRLGDRGAGIACLLTLLPRHQADGETMRMLTRRLLDLDAYDQAETAANALLALRPDDHTGVLAKAIAAAARGNTTEAVAEIQSRLGDDPAAAVTTSQVLLEVDDPLGAWTALPDGSDERVPVRHAVLVAQRLLHHGHASLAVQAAERVLAMSAGDPDIRRRSEAIVGEARVLRGEWSPPENSMAAVSAVPRRVLHVVGASAPHRQSGYTVRTQSIVQAQRAVGLDPHVVTPLGFPWRDGIDEAEILEDVDGVPHHRLAPFDAARGVRYDRRAVMAMVPTRADDLLTASATRLATLGQTVRPAVVHAASDFRNALLALQLGRCLDIPVVYEMRGFWEETWLSHSAQRSIESEVYQWRKALEVSCAMRADRVVTLAEVMKSELVSRGVPVEKIVVVPNAVDVDVFVPVERDQELAAALEIDPAEVTLGYISSLAPYEGIDYLIEATARLAGQGYPVRTLLVGDGTERDRLVRHAADHGVSDRVIFTGRVPHHEVLHYYGLIDVFVVPRTADRVSQLVTPLKPYEAMATGRTLVVSGVPALAEMVIEGETGVVFDPENAAHLASVVASLLDNPMRRRVLGSSAREWVCRHRTWEQNGRRYVELYRALGVPLVGDEPAVQPLALHS